MSYEWHCDDHVIEDGPYLIWYYDDDTPDALLVGETLTLDMAQHIVALHNAALVSEAVTA